MITLLLLPGMDGTGNLFDSFVEKLGGVCHIKVVSYPGELPLDYSGLETLVRDEIPPVGPFVILGESFSGPIAISLAAAYPDRLLGLVLCCTFARNPFSYLSIFNKFLGLLPLSIAPVRALSHLVLGKFSCPALRSAVVDATAQVSATTLRSRVHAVLSLDVTEKLRKVNVPVLYLQALQDRVVPSSAGQWVVECCHQTHVVKLDAPHFLLQAVPSEAAKVVTGFIRELETV